MDTNRHEFMKSKVGGQTSAQPLMDTNEHERGKTVALINLCPLVFIRG